jgi:hypothetical protein
VVNLHVAAFPLKTSPDYIDYLPKGVIVRKASVMGYLLERNNTPEVSDWNTSGVLLKCEVFCDGDTDLRP